VPDEIVYPEGAPFPGTIGRTIADSSPAWPVPPRAKRGAPNVVVILLDDVGFAELGPFGGTIETPTFDRLAANGLRYRDFHTTALCSPTRACLMTGRNHHATGAGIITGMATGFPGYNTMISRENGFLSEMLLQEGYATFAVGKWHLQPNNECNAAAPRKRWPLGRGIERFYGFLIGMTNQWYPDLVEDNRFVAPPRTPAEGYHLTEDLADRSIAMIKDVRSGAADKPFFLYLCPGAGHTPHHVPREWTERYRGRFDQGWDRLREEIFARQLASGIVPPGTQLSPRPEGIAAWESLSADEQRLCAREMEVYAAFLSHTDHHIGRVVSFLEQIGELDNTLLLLMSDNGASAEGGPLGSYSAQMGNNGREPTLEENLAAIDRWGDPTTFPHYARGWAWAGNTPLRRWKRFVHEGGVSDPLIVHWPAGIRAKGEVRGQYAHAIDVLPTVLDALGIESPSEIDGVKLAPIHGVSFAHTFDDGAAPTKKDAQYFEMLGSRAIWHDGWKAVTAQPPNVVLTEALLAEQRWELYHTAEDFSECNDLARQAPETVRELEALWWAEAEKYNVLPLDARGLVRVLAPMPALGTVSDRYVYHQGAAPIMKDGAVNVHNRSHTISAEVVIPEGGAEGVLLAQGGRFAGFSLFVQGGRLRYTHNYLGVREHRVVSDVDVPIGACTLRFQFTRTGEHRGVGALFIGERKVGEAEIAETVPNAFDRTGEGLCCGYDSSSPVSREYEAPFAFTGAIARVTVEVEGAAHLDAAADERAAMASQ